MKMADGSIMGALNRGDITICPRPDDVQVQPCSIDLRLGRSFRTLSGPSIVTTEYELPPGGFVLACTRERVGLGNAFMAQVHGKSTWARRGLLVEAAGLVDPNFEGTITLEMFNMGPSTISLSAGVTICQITFERLDWPAVRPYGHPDLNSHYQGQTRATPAAE